MGKDKPKNFTGDPRLDAAFLQLAEILIDVADNAEAKVKSAVAQTSAYSDPEADIDEGNGGER